MTEHVNERIAQQIAAPPPSPFGLFLVMPNFAEASRNHGRNLQEGRATVIQAALERP